MSGTISIMTYNINICCGRDGRCLPERIAEVIGRYNPDVVALQEVDANVSRTDFVRQASCIAESLDVDFHFHAVRQIEEGSYGNALLSRHPMRLVRAADLPGLAGRPRQEKRGALWAEVSMQGRKIQVITTHLGRNRRERLAQSRALLGREWLNSPHCLSPAILCGDFNFLPGSPAYRQIRSSMSDAGNGTGKRSPRTWPSRFPLLRLDYVFVSPDLAVQTAHVPRNDLTQAASDHLPLLIELRLPGF